ncbi:right-handed parallel beta-helix repeat-containing protein [Longibacter sp.]|uniref:right-handed parallel beta-helix repeat-containing protein n=1 Tax=Longibacter sp. TaxID=2045415 RepID=UPI003EB7A03E
MSFLPRCVASAITLILTVGLVQPAPVNGQIYVREGASGTGTLSDPYGSLQDAIADGSSNDIRVAEGTYFAAATDRTASFELRNALEIVGGWAPDFSTRDPSTYTTTLSGDIDGDGTLAGNSYQIVVAPSGVTSATVIDGVTIADGNADSFVTQDGGAGLYIDSASPTVRNVIFRGNGASVGGGGVFVDGGAPNFESVVFEANTASSLGGGGFLSINGMPTLNACTFTANTAQAGGGLYVVSGSVTLTGSTFSSNTASGGGGAVFTDGGTLSVTRSVFGQNVTSGTFGGGAIYLVGADARFTSTTFAGNDASGMIPGGAIQAVEGSTVEAFNSVFSGNDATGSRGGAVYLFDSVLQATNTTMASNAAADGSAVFVDGTGSAILQNVILWPQAAQVTSGSGTVSVGAALIDGGLPAGASLLAGAPPVIDADPLFADADGPDGTTGTLDDDLRVDLASSVVGYGLFAALPSDDGDLDDDGNTAEFLPLDLADTPRVEDSHLADGDSGGPDLGAYETPTRLIITGTADNPPEDSDYGEDSGWRMMATPAQAAVDDIADDIDFGPNGLSGSPPTAMIYQWDDAAPNDTSSFSGVWSALSSLTDPLPSGIGFILFFFDDQRDPIRPSVPLVFDVPGDRPNGTFVVDNLSPTALYHLIGNPFPQAYDVDALTIGGTSGFQAFVWIWDPETEAYNRLEQGTAGDVVASWQGFFIERSPGSTATTVTFDASGRISEVPFVGKQGASERVTRIGVRLTAVDNGQAVFTDDLLEVSFRRGAVDAWDVWDATRPGGPAGDQMRPRIVINGQRLERWVEKAHESRPLPLGRGVRLPVNVRTEGWTGKLHIDASVWEHVPPNWSVWLIDTRGTIPPGDDIETRLRPGSEGYTFVVDGDSEQGGAQPAGTQESRPFSANYPQRTAAAGEEALMLASSATHEFVLVVSPGPAPGPAWDVQAHASGTGAVLSWPDDLSDAAVLEHSRDGGAWSPPTVTLDRRRRTGRVIATLSDLRSGRYRFRLRMDTDAGTSYSEEVPLRIQMTRAVQIRQASPNPILGSGGMAVTVRERQEVSVELFDVLGRRVAVLYRGTLPAERTEQIRIDADQLGLDSGTYVVRVRGEEFLETHRVAVLR